MTPPVVLSIAATDSGGAAGLAADLTTFAALGVHGACAVTAVTAQDTTAVHSVIPLAAPDVARQIDAVLGDLAVAAIKTGVLGSEATAQVVAGVATQNRHIPLIVDPVLVSTTGGELASDKVLRSYRQIVLPVATVITPNREEASRLLGGEGPSVDMARALHEFGPAVVLTGGHPDGATCTDILVDHSGALSELAHPAIATDNDHGTGCTFSAALAAGLARGEPLELAVRHAQRFVARAIHISKTWRLGRGRGPVAHTQHAAIHNSVTNNSLTNNKEN
ncbi:MAG: bifunctional hydroxymethylpyrimidine kinase/phosphomethylpyrimidine kinase [Actinomycetota bacterium]|nr:bifunctional hydroxymethylpyrimidine kinase/phosphomethylpyrimidine kinase [Actinomycetota bacterium]